MTSNDNHLFPNSQTRTLSVQGLGESACTPDNFQMTVSLSSTKTTTQEAEASVKKRCDYVLQVLRNHGHTSDCIHIKTSTTDTNEMYVYNMRIEVNGTDYEKLDQAKQMLKEKLSSSVICSDIRSFISFKHRVKKREEAFKEAIMSAKSKGSLVSKCMGGVELGPVITLTEDTIEERPLPQENTSNKQKHDTVDEPIVMITCSHLSRLSAPPGIVMEQLIQQFYELLYMVTDYYTYLKLSFLAFFKAFDEFLVLFCMAVINDCAQVMIFVLRMWIEHHRLVSVSVFVTVVLLVLIWMIFQCVLRLIKPRIKFQEMNIDGPYSTGLMRQAEDFKNKGVIESCRIWVSEYPKLCGIHYYGTPYVLINDMRLINWALHFNRRSIHSNLIQCARLWRKSSSMYRPTLGYLYTLNMNWVIQPRGVPQPASLPLGHTFFLTPEWEDIANNRMLYYFHKHSGYVLEEVTDACRLRSDIGIAKLFDRFALQSCIKLFTGKHVNLIKGESDELSRSIAKLFEPRKKQTLLSKYEMMSSYFSPLNPYFWSQFYRRKECREFDHALAVFGKIALHRNFYYLVLPYEDILTAIIESHTYYNILLDNETVKLTCFGVFLACYFSMSHILTSTVYLLATNPEKQKILNKEITEFFLYDEERVPTDAVDEIPYLTSVIQESIRMYPPCAWTTLSCLRKTEVSDFEGTSTIRKGCEVLIPYQAVYRATHNWDDPDAFIPERFTSLGSGSLEIEEDTIYRPTIACYTSHGPHGAVITKTTLTGVKLMLIQLLTYFKFEKAVITRPYQTNTSSVFGNVQVPVDDLRLRVLTY